MRLGLDLRHIGDPAEVSAFGAVVSVDATHGAVAPSSKRADPPSSCGEQRLEPSLERNVETATRIARDGAAGAEEQIVPFAL